MTTPIDLRTALPQIITNTLPGPKAQALLDRRAKAIPAAIKSVYPLVIERGEGAMVEDLDGNLFLDWVGGVGVLNVGYSQPEIIKALKDQSDKYLHAMMNIITHEPYIALAEKLGSLAPIKGADPKTMLVNSGAEAVENAVKIAKGATGRSGIIVFTGAFHGRTTMAMTMTSKKAYAKGMGPFPDGVYRAEFPYLYRAPKYLSEEEALPYYIENLEALFVHAASPDQVAAIVFEPIQGEGGFVPAPFAWVKAVRDICDKYGILMICDEVQTGFARSGKMFVSNYYKEFNAGPDILICAKSIAAGMPLSAVIAGSEIMNKVPIGTIGGTYNGNPMSCVASLKTIEFIESNNLCKRALDISDQCLETFNRWKGVFECVGDVRGIGSMLGIEFVTDKESRKPNSTLVNTIVDRALDRGLILENAGTYGNVIRFLSPLVITDDQLEAGLKIFEEVLAEVSS